MAGGARITHPDDTAFTQSLREFFAYRDLGIGIATRGEAVAHVIRANGASEEARDWHRHNAKFQMVYVLKGWVDFEYEGQGRTRLEAGACVYQPRNVRHREMGHSADLEMLEVAMPADFKTFEAP